MVLFEAHSYINVLHTTRCKKERRSDETPVAVFPVEYQIYPSPKSDQIVLESCQMFIWKDQSSSI